MKKSHIILLIAFLSVLSACKKEKEEEVKSTPPNIVFIMSDDHAYQAISAYGYGLNETPNIDRIGEEGVRFTQSTVTNSLCAPSRAVMLTGKHSHVNGKLDIATTQYNWNQDNVMKRLQDGGYQTAIIGKVHLAGAPQGFDYYSALIDQGEYYNPDFVINGDTTQIEGYVTDLISDMTLDWIQNRDQSKPFAVLYHNKAPHREWLPALRYIKEYTQKEFPEPETLFDDFENRGEAAKAAEMNILKHMNWAGDSKITPAIMDELGIEETSGWGKEAYENNLGRMNAEQRAAWDSVYDPIMEDFKARYSSMSGKELMQWRYQRYMQDYMGTVAAIDDGVGDLLDFLKENDLEENTIVVYTSDQGFYLGEHGWFDKRFMYEESEKMPLLIRYPKEIEAGTASDALVQNLDFAPTFLDYAGLPIPAEMQGQSFRKIVSGENTNPEEWREGVYYSYYGFPAIHMVKRHYGIRTHRYKLIHFYYDIDEWELYDLKKDPEELNNVYDDPDYAEIRTDLHKQLEELREKYKDSDENDQRFIEDIEGES